MSRKLLISSVILTIGSSILLLSTRLVDPRMIGSFLSDWAIRFGIGNDPDFMLRICTWGFLFLVKVGLATGAGGALVLWSFRRFLGEARTDALLINLLVFGTTLVILLIISEFALRFIFRDVTTTGDNKSYFARRWYKSHVHRNTWRFREREIALAKPDNVYRIAVIGDSFTFGQGVLEQDRFTNLLEKYLNEKTNGYRYEVLNFGKPGAETVDEIVILRDFVLPANPNFILLQWYINDFEGHDKKGRPESLPLLSSATLHSLLYGSSVFYYLMDQEWNLLQDRLGLSGSYKEYMLRRFGDPESSESREAIKTLKDFIGLCQSQGTPMGLMLFPDIESDLGATYAFDSLHNQVLEVCAQEGITCIDLRSTFAPYDYKKLWVNRFDSHPNSLANRLIAGRLMDVYEQTWLSKVSDAYR